MAEDMRRIQMDTYLGRADEVVPSLIALGPMPTTADGQALDEPDAVGTLRSVESMGCAAYATLELAVMRAIFDDDLGQIAREYVGSPMSWEALIEVLNPASLRRQTPGSAAGSGPAPAAILAGVIDQTAASLRTTYGEPSTPTWGRPYRNLSSGSRPSATRILPLEWYFNSGLRPVAGADGAVDNNYYRVHRAYADPYDPDYVPLGAWRSSASRTARPTA